MGNPNDQPKSSSSSSINHFSHPHPLQLSNHSHNPIPAAAAAAASPCSGCKLDVASGGLVYNCTICNYFLHTKCSQMPQQITHPSDPNHVLSLLPKPVYVEGVFNCDACGQQGNGFSYHCQSCSLDYHILCASFPMTFMHQSHHHPLNLVFSPPYPTKTFSCDLCKRAGSNHWLYRCSACEFDVHLTCININKTSQHHPAQQALQAPQLVSSRNLVGSRPPIPQQPMYSQFQQPMIIARPPMSQMSNNPNSFAYSTPVMSSGSTRVVQSQPQTRVLAAPYARTTTPMPMQQQQQSLLPMQVFAAAPYARTPTPMPQQQQSLLPMQNSMNFGGSAGYGRQNNTLMEQMILSGMNGIASGASQSITGALIPDFMGGGNGSNDSSSRGMFDDGNLGVGGVSHLQADFGGGVGDMMNINGYNDAMAMDQGTYGSLDINGYEQHQMDGGIMAENMNQMMDATQFDPAGMVGGDMSHME